MTHHETRRDPSGGSYDQPDVENHCCRAITTVLLRSGVILCDLSCLRQLPWAIQASSGQHFLSFSWPAKSPIGTSATMWHLFLTSG